MKLPVLFISCLGLLTFGRASAAESPQPRTAAEAGIGRLIQEAGFDDLSGTPRKLSSLVAESPFTVIAVTSPSCPLSQKFAPTLAALENEWKAKGVRFLFTGAIESDPPEALATFAKTHGWEGICTPDAKQALLQALGASQHHGSFHPRPVPHPALPRGGG